MQDIALILLMLALVLYMYFIIAKSETVFNKQKSNVKMETQVSMIRIVAKSPSFMNAMADGISKAQSLYPFIKFSLKCVKDTNLIQNLMNGEVDIVLASEEEINMYADTFSIRKVFYSNDYVQAKIMNIPIVDNTNHGYVYIVWNEKICSMNRDKVLSLIGMGIS